MLLLENHSNGSNSSIWAYSVLVLNVDVSNSQKQLISVINYVFICGIISIFGTVSNVINLVIYYRQGLNTTINISFFSLAVSDLCSLVIQHLFNIYVNPFFVNSNVPIVHTEIQYITSGVVRETFARITCFITVYITAERYLCIAFPLHVKQMITPKRTITVMVLIFTMTFLSTIPLYITAYFSWRFYPNLNKTLLGLSFTEGKDIAEAFVYTLHAICGFLSFSGVVVFTIILTKILLYKNTWRQNAHVDLEKADSMSKKDRATVAMIVVISTILIICYIPSVALFLVTFFEPEFATGGNYYNLYYVLWSVCVITENINSSVNIFFYYKMSTKYRKTFKELFLGCFYVSKKPKNK